MTKHLIYFNWQLRKPHFGLVMDHLDQILENENNEVSFIYCTGDLKPCYTNRLADPNICKICKLNSRTAFSHYSEKVEFIKLEELKSKKILEKFKYSNVEDLKKIEYKGINIGFSALSSYISFSLNLEPELNQSFRTYMDSLLANEVMLIEKTGKYLENNNVDHVTIFNGRTADVRPVFEIVKLKNIDVTVLELIKDTNTSFWKEEYQNSLPHDIEFRHKRMMALWNREDIALETKLEKGKSFYERRRNGKLTRDVKVYTDTQKIGVLPSSWSDKSRNITIFLSSENEFAAIGDIWDKLALFETQEKALHWIGQNFQDEKVKIYIRIHPNLKSVKYGYHRRLYDLHNLYPQLEVIPAESDVSSYALIDNSEKIVTFGSTIGIEATYWNKPSIQLAGSYYYYLDATYKPKTKRELINLLNQELAPHAQNEAIKYGFHLMGYKDYATKSKYSPLPLNFLGVKYGLSPYYLKLFNSRIVFKIIEVILKRLLPSNAQFKKMPSSEVASNN